MSLKEISRGMYIDDTVLEFIVPNEIDGIVFDCDGVLVDISDSYNSTIIKTSQHILYAQSVSDEIVEILSSDLMYGIIDDFKATGMFNNDIDITYSIILTLLAVDRLGGDPSSLLSNVYENATLGITGVVSYLRSLLDISDIEEYLSYPSDSSVLMHTFDQLFYGPELYNARYGLESKFTEPGLINRDRVILDLTLLDTLTEQFEHIAMITGRGYSSAHHSLGSLLDRFDIQNSLFLEDQPRSLAKPNPATLLKSISNMGCKNTIYVGDSMEDLNMTRAANLGTKLLFCGVYGTNHDPKRRLEMLQDQHVDMLVNSIHDIPKILNLVQRIRDT